MQRFTIIRLTNNYADELNPGCTHLMHAHVHCVPTQHEWDIHLHIHTYMLWKRNVAGPCGEDVVGFQLH